MGIILDKMHLELDFNVIEEEGKILKNDLFFLFA